MNTKAGLLIRRSACARTVTQPAIGINAMASRSAKIATAKVASEIALLAGLGMASSEKMGRLNDPSDPHREVTLPTQ